MRFTLVYARPPVSIRSAILLGVFLGSGALTADPMIGVSEQETRMPRAASRDRIYYRRRYTSEVIELCVRWYLTYRLSYRDLSAVMAGVPRISWTR